MLPELWEKVKVRINSFHYFKGLDDIINIISYSTAEQDTKGMTIYLDKIKDHASKEMNILLLNRDEKSFLDFYNEYK